MSYLNMSQVRAAWMSESADLTHATEDQIDQLCEELGHDRPQMRWDNMQEEMQIMLAEARYEFEIGGC